MDCTTINTRALEILGDSAGTRYGAFTPNAIGIVVQDMVDRTGCGSRVDYCAVNGAFSPATAFYTPSALGAPAPVPSPALDTLSITYKLVTYKGRPLPMLNLEDMYEDWQTVTGSDPYGWLPAIWGDDVSASVKPAIRIYPDPGADIGSNLLVRYSANHQDTIGGSEVPYLIPPRFHTGVVYEVVSRAYRLNNEDADVRKADTYHGMYLELCERLTAVSTQQNTTMGACVPYRDL